jgi:hypothetical protein
MALKNMIYQALPICFLTSYVALNSFVINNQEKVANALENSIEQMHRFYVEHEEDINSLEMAFDHSIMISSGVWDVTYKSPKQK